MGKDHSRFSALPDDILLNILDRLDVRDAARTSILSRRWSQLSAKLSRLIINAQDFAPEGVSGDNVSADDLAKMNAAAVEATKSILTRRKPGEHTIRLLSTTFYLRDDAPISIGLAVDHAMAIHLVEMAKFRVLTEKFRFSDLSDDDFVTYGKEFMRFFDACPNAFGGLTSLDLENLRFGETDISNVLITCKRLKRLRLFNCDSGDPSTLQVEHSHLTELSIVGCLFEQVKLNWLPQLTQMVFDDWIDFQDPLVLDHVPLLEAVSLTNLARSFHKMVKLSEFLSRTTVRDLKLGFRSEKIWVQPECPTESLASVFCQLRFLNLVDLPEGYDVTWTMFILEAAPLLKELYMTVWDHACLMVMDKEVRKEGLYSENKGVVKWESAAAGFQHHCLDTLVIFGFTSEDYLVNYLRRVMAVVVNLEDVFLYSRLECDNCPDTKPIKFPWTKRQRISLKKRITAGIESFIIIHSSGKLRADQLLVTCSQPGPNSSSRSPSCATVPVRGGRRATRFPRLAGGQTGVPLPLRRLLRRRESGGNLDLRLWRVYSRSRWSAGGVVEMAMLLVWSLVSACFLSCDGVLRSSAAARATCGGRRSMDLAVCAVSGDGLRAGGGGHFVEFLSPGSISATARRAPALPWSLGGLCGRWSRPRSLLPPSAGDGGDGDLDASLAQGWRKVGGRSGFTRSRIEGAVADGRSSFHAPAASSDDSCSLKAWWCSLLRVLRWLPFFFSGVAGGGGRQCVRWFSVAVVSVLCFQMYEPAYVSRIVLSVL